MPLLPEPQPRHRPRHRAKSHPVRLLTVGATLGALAVSVSLAAPAYSPGQRDVVPVQLGQQPLLTPQGAQPGTRRAHRATRPVPATHLRKAPESPAQWLRRLESVTLTPAGPVMQVPPARRRPPQEIRMPSVTSTPSPTTVVVIADPPRLPGTPSPRPTSPPVVTPPATPSPKPPPRSLPSPTTVVPTPEPTTATPSPTTTEPVATPEPTRHHRHHRRHHQPCPSPTGTQEGSSAPPTPEPSLTTTVGNPEEE